MSRMMPYVKQYGVAHSLIHFHVVVVVVFFPVFNGAWETFQIMTHKKTKTNQNKCLSLSLVYIYIHISI